MLLRVDVFICSLVRLPCVTEGSEYCEMSARRGDGEFPRACPATDSVRRSKKLKDNLEKHLLARADVSLPCRLDDHLCAQAGLRFGHLMIFVLSRLLGQRWPLRTASRGEDRQHDSSMSLKTRAGIYICRSLK